MEKFYRVRIETEKVEGREYLSYPEELGADFVILAYNGDRSEGIAKVKLSKAAHERLQKNKAVKKLTRPQAEKQVEEFRSPSTDVAKDTIPGPLPTLAMAEPILEAGAIDKPPTDLLTEWSTPDLENGWVNFNKGYNPPGFYRDSTGIVHLRGLIKGGKSETNTLLFHLPVGYRPEYRYLFIIPTYPIVAGRLDVTPKGDVLLINGNNKGICLDNISFRAFR